MLHAFACLSFDNGTRVGRQAALVAETTAQLGALPGNTSLSSGTTERHEPCKHVHSVRACFHALDVQEKRLDFSVQKQK